MIPLVTNRKWLYSRIRNEYWPSRTHFINIFFINIPRAVIGLSLDCHHRHHVFIKTCDKLHMLQYFKISLYKFNFSCYLSQFYVNKTLFLPIADL